MFLLSKRILIILIIILIQRDQNQKLLMMGYILNPQLNRSNLIKTIIKLFQLNKNKLKKILTKYKIYKSFNPTPNKSNQQ